MKQLVWQTAVYMIVMLIILAGLALCAASLNRSVMTQEGALGALSYA